MSWTKWVAMITPMDDLIDAMSIAYTCCAGAIVAKRKFAIVADCILIAI